MRIAGSPFYLLDVNPSSTVAEINEAAEDKAFMDPDNEQKYNNARTELATANKRLPWEVRWFYGNNGRSKAEAVVSGMADAVICDNALEELLIGIEQLYSCDSDEAADIIFAWCSESYDEIFDKEDDEGGNVIDYLWENISESRKNAGISALRGRGELEKAVRDLANDVENGIANLFDRFNEKTICDIFNEVSKDMEGSSGMNAILERAINLYALRYDGILSQQRDVIMQMIPVAKSYTLEKELEILCNSVQEFDYTAQPIQVFLMNRGQSILQEQSVEVAKAVRDLAWYYVKEKENFEFALKLLNLELELFSELPELFELVKSDKVFVSCFDSCIKLKDAVDRNVEGAVGKIEAFIHGALMDQLHHSLYGDSSDILSEVANIEANCALSMIIHYANESRSSGKWNSCLELIRKLKTLQITDPELQHRIAENEGIIRNNKMALQFNSPLFNQGTGNRSSYESGYKHLTGEGLGPVVIGILVLFFLFVIWPK